jgi:hypothetical protein
MSDLKYVGDGRAIVGIPADTINAATLEALAAKRGRKPAELRKELVDSGLYAEKPEKESKE